MDPVVLRFPAPNRPLSLNEAGRMHWAARRGRLHPWREEVGWAWKIQGRRTGLKDVPCTVQLVLPFDTNRRRDGHNYSLVYKAIIDELVLMGVWPDDTPEWVEVLDPTFVVDKQAEVEVHLTPRGGACSGSSRG